MTTRKEREQERAAKREGKAVLAPAPEVEAPPAPPVRQPDFVWAGQPVYQCHFGCKDRYERINDLAAVEEHERSQHPTNLRLSELLGPDGRPLIVRTD